MKNHLSKLLGLSSTRTEYARDKDYITGIELETLSFGQGHINCGITDGSSVNWTREADFVFIFIS